MTIALAGIGAFMTKKGATTKRVYEDLERDGFIYSVTGKGSLVKGVNVSLLWV